MSNGRDPAAARILRQIEAMGAAIFDCYRCGGTGGAYDFKPTPHGFVCHRCLREMPTREFRDLRAVCEEYA